MRTTKDVLLDCIIGDHARVQFLRECLTGAKDKKREAACELSFLTKEITTNNVVNNDGKVGFILWVDREELAKIEMRLK